MLRMPSGSRVGALTADHFQRGDLWWTDWDCCMLLLNLLPVVHVLEKVDSVALSLQYALQQ
jgi:hypothetical protein